MLFPDFIKLSTEAMNAYGKSSNNLSTTNTSSKQTKSKGIDLNGIGQGVMQGVEAVGDFIGEVRNVTSNKVSKALGTTAALAGFADNHVQAFRNQQRQQKLQQKSIFGTNSVLPQDNFNGSNPLMQSDDSFFLQKKGGKNIKCMNVGGAAYDVAKTGANFIPGVGPLVSMGMGMLDSTFDITGRQKDARERDFLANKLPGALSGLSSYLPQAGDGMSITSLMNPKNWGVTDMSDEKTFSKAYSKAKTKGEKEFLYKGKRYNTNYNGTIIQELKQYGIDGKKLKEHEYEEPILVTTYPPGSRYLPGHIAAKSVDGNVINYGPLGNTNDLTFANRKGEKSYLVFKSNKEKFNSKSQKLNSKNNWNLFTNNCADNTCDGLDIPRSKLIETPVNTISKIKKKYPTLDITGRSMDDYYNLIDNYEDKNLSDRNKLLSFYYDESFDESDRKYAAEALQKALNKKGSKLKVDGIIGKETKAALSTNKFKSGGRVIDAPHMGGVYIEYDED